MKILPKVQSVKEHKLHCKLFHGAEAIENMLDTWGAKVNSKFCLQESGILG